MCTTCSRCTLAAGQGQALVTVIINEFARLSMSQKSDYVMEIVYRL